MIDLLYALAFLLPGLLLSAMAALLGRTTSRALAVLAGTEPRWARRYARFGIAVIATAGLALLLIGAALGWIILRG